MWREWNSESPVLKKLANGSNGVDCIHVNQGNTFYLRFEIANEWFRHLFRVTRWVCVGAS